MVKIIFFLLFIIYIIYNYKNNHKNKNYFKGGKNNLCNLLDKSYENSNLYGISHDKYNTTYGELECNSIDNIFKSLSINNNDVIYDLGSGGGKFLIYIYLKYKLNCIGIEIIEHRHNKACEIFKQYKNNKNNKNNIRFINNDFFKSDFSKGNIFYSCNTCWDDKLNNKIINKILKESNMKYILFAKSTNNPKLKLYKTINVDWTWHKNSSLYIYTKK